MNWIRNKKNRIIISLVTGIFAAMLSAGTIQNFSPQKSLAWWGVLYPEFCFSPKPREITIEKNTEEHPCVKISFWLAKALDW